MSQLPWRRLVLLVVASGVFAALVFPTAAVIRPDTEWLREQGIELQRPDHTPLRTAAEPPLEPTPQGKCGPGSRPETDLQGRVTPDDHSSGRAANGFTCNTKLVGKYTKPTTVLNTVPGFETTFGTVGGFKVLRYVDDDGHECAYYDTTLLFPTNIFDALTGVNVMDMSDPSNPVLSDRLVTPSMLSPHESLVLSRQRGLLAAVTGNPAAHPGVVDVYDISQDCRHPVLRSSTPTGILGHESGMAPDGRTFYSGSAGGNTLTAVDITDPSLPVPLWAGTYSSHGLSISNDGNRAYVATTDGALGQSGLTILDTSEVQARELSPQVREVARLEWEGMSIPQNAIPVTIHGHPYLVEIDEFGTLDEVGAGRIIDIADETNPQVVSNLRLEVHEPEHFGEISGDVGAGNPLGGYAGHYCNVPRRTNPKIVACSMILSGLRVFDIRDPENPREVAYFNAPITPRTFPGGSGFPPGASNWAMSSPSFASARGEIWYSDGYSGFYAVRVTNGAWPGAGQGEDGGNGGGGGGGGGDDGGGGGDSSPGSGDGNGPGAGGAGANDGAAGSGSPGPVPSAASNGAGDSGLPFTGLVVGGLALLAVGLLAGGLALRWSAIRRE